MIEKRIKLVETVRLSTHFEVFSAIYDVKFPEKIMFDIGVDKKLFFGGG